MLQRVPATNDTTGHDPMTGGVAPAGRRSRVAIQPLRLAQGERISSHYQGIEEIADMWQPGDADCGIAPRASDGRILPRIDHVPWGHALTDITGADLDVTDAQIEASRRSWYAERMNSAPRLTPVQHIIGQSEPEWHGRLTWRDEQARDDWRAKLWEPEHLKRLMATYEGIYAIDWGRLPDDKILAPLTTQHRRAEAEGKATEPPLRLKLQRAKADLTVVREIALAVGNDDMEAAGKAHAKLAENAKTYNAEAAKLEGIGVGLGAFQRFKKAGKR